MLHEARQSIAASRVTIKNSRVLIFFEDLILFLNKYTKKAATNAAA